MLTKQVVLKHDVGLRNYAVVRDAATLSNTIQETEETSIIEMISQHKSEALKLRQDLLDPDRSPDGETETLWEYVLVSTKLENLRDTLYLEWVRAERRAKEQESSEKPAESGVRCSEDVDAKNNNDVVEDQNSQSEVINAASIDNDDYRTDDEDKELDYKIHCLIHGTPEQQLRNALSAVQKGGKVLNKARHEIWDWLCENRSNPYVPADFRQMMEQHADAVGNDLVHITPRVREELADRLGGRAVGY